MNNDYSHIWDSMELFEDFETLECKLVKAKKHLAEALTELDHLLQDVTASAWGHELEPDHVLRVAENALALNEAHDSIAAAKKDLFQFKLKHGDINELKHGKV